MPSRPELVERLRNLIASLAVVGAVGAGVLLVDSPPSPVDVLRIGAFNIQVFGQTKLAQEDIMNVLVETAQQFDVLVVQEVRDASEHVADEFLDLINAQSEHTYAMVEGPRLGRTPSKEQYVIYYIPERVRLARSFTLSDQNDDFERDPLVATFQSGHFDFTLLACHIKPDVAEAELEALRDAALSLLEAEPAERDLILLGDFNADGHYLDEQQRLFEIFPPEQFDVVITNDMVTMTTSNNSYDRLVLREATSRHEYILGTARPFHFDAELGLTEPTFIRRVSDHHPIVARFRTDLEDDD